MNLTQISTVLAALGSAAFGGVLFGFSTLVMPGLNASPAPAAISTMQQINKVAPRSLLAVDMVVTLLLCLVVAVASVLSLRSDGSRLGIALVVLACALYAASFAITAIYHIPHNDAFAQVAAQGPHAAQSWSDYARPWEAWNHVRAACALAGSATMIAGLLTRTA